ncbi:MAG: ribbon-helix-helix domain-containing protein [Scytonematopsis contorta HA4267-MV1]|jgi:uncharacterized protein (DUF1778 family)|nr:ribbon-helix-helix domain-containing protein [Scytonematopsis contorta HA4267-MV1]
MHKKLTDGTVAAKVSFKLPQTDKEMMELAAASRGMTVSEFIREAILDKLF